MTRPSRLLDADLRPPHAEAGMRIGLLGGSFNPPHAGHRLITETALRRLGLDQVWWMATPGNPLKERADLAPLGERIRLSQRLSHNPRIKVTAFEQALGTSYTAQSLDWLTRRFPDVRLVWLMGADNLAHFHRWKDWPAIFELAPIAVIDRPNWRYRALGSIAANRYARYRIPESEAALLPGLASPVWCYLSGRLSNLSSTALRAPRAFEDVPPKPR
jgi:nicotinate-nucleotide adenylyltransferase